MSEFEKEEFKNRMKGLSEEEKLLAVRAFPTDMLWDELRRRDSINREIISSIRQIAKVVE